MSTKIRNLQNIDGANVTNPDANAFTTNSIEAYANDAAFEAAFTPVAGSIYWNTTEKLLREYNGTAWQYDKTTLLAATDSTTTGADQSITPAVAQVIRFTSSTLASIINIVPTLQKYLYLFNGQTTQAITIKHDTGGTAANRILTGNGLDFVLKTGQNIGLFYDNISSRWRIMSSSLTSSLEGFANDAAYVSAHGTASLGDNYWNTTTLVARFFDGTDWINDKVLFSTENNTAATGANADLTPVKDQIIKVSNASLTSIRGIIPSIQKFLILINGTGASIVIRNDNLITSSVNRIFTGTGVDISLANNASLLLAYDGNSSLWRVVGGSGSASGSGIKNYIPTASQNSASGWGVSGAGIAVATESTATNFPDNITQTSALRITRASGSDYAYVRWTQDQADYNWLSGILFALKYAGTAGDYTLGLFTNTASNYSGSYVSVTLPTTSIPAASTGTNFGPIPGVAGGSGTQFMELRINGIAGTTPLYLNAVTFTPNPPGQGAAISDTSIFTPPGSQGLGTLGVNRLQQRRVGSFLHISGQFQIGTATAAQARLNLPTGLTVGIFSSGTIICSVGTWARDNSSASTSKNGIVLAFPGNDYITFGSNDYTAALSPDANQNGSTLFPTVGQTIYPQGEWVIPIAQWAGNGTLNLGAGAQVEYASSTTGTWDAAAAAGNTVYGPSGSPISGTLTANRQKVVQFQYPIQTDDILVLEYFTGTGWISQEMSNSPFTATAGQGFGGYISATTSTTATIQFYQYAVAGTTYNSLTGAINWSSSVPGSAWRVRKVKASSPVGFGLADATSSGLLSTTTQTIVGLKTFNDGLKLDDAASQTTLNTYQEDDTTLASVQWDPNGSGVNSSSFAVKCTRVGRLATITFPRSIDATGAGGTTTSLSLTVALPTFMRPSVSALEFPVFIFSNATVEATPGMIEVATNGTISVFRTSTAIAFGTGACGLERTSISYSV
jgi:hypothetical protein